MPSLRKLESARNNAAKSTGPVTPEGKSRSCMNGLKHGFAATRAVFSDEERPQFDALLNGYIETFQPANEPEHNLVDQMAVATWRLYRLYAAEAALFEPAAQVPAIDPSCRFIAAFKDLAGPSTMLYLMLRYEANARWQFDRALRNLNELRKLPEPPFTPPSKVNVYFCPNKPDCKDGSRLEICPKNTPEPTEPNPESEHSAELATRNQQLTTLRSNNVP